MKKRWMILLAVGMFAFSTPVYAVTQDSTSAESSDESVSASSDSAASDNETISDAITVTQEAADPVSHVTSMIEALPAYSKLTMNDKQVVDEIQTAYDDLSDVQKERVLNRETLNRAQQKLQEIRDQSLYTYSFTLTDKYPVARMALSYAPPSDDSLDTQVQLGSKTDEAAFEVISPDKESFILTPDTKSYDTKTVHFTVTWSNQSAEIKAENCELGTWFLKSSYPVSFAVQKYESTDQLNGEVNTSASSEEVSSSSVSTPTAIQNDTNSETKEATNADTNTNPSGNAANALSNPFIGVIGMLAAVAAIGVGAVLLFRFLSKKKFSQTENDSESESAQNALNNAVSQIQNAESMDDLKQILNSKWETDLGSASDSNVSGQQKEQKSGDPFSDWDSVEMSSQAPKEAAQPQKQQDADTEDDDYGFAYNDNSGKGGNETAGSNASSDSMHDSDFMDDDDDSDVSRDTTYLSYEENIDEETGILSNDATKIKHKQPFYPKDSYDPDSDK